MARLAAALVFSALLSALASVAASQDVNTTDTSLSDSISSQQSSSETFSESIADVGAINSSEANNVEVEIQSPTNLVPEIDTNLNTATESIETTNSNKNLVDANSSNDISRRALEEAYNIVKTNPNINEENKQREIYKPIKEEFVQDPVSLHLENDVIKPLHEITDNKQKSTFVRSADDSGDLDDNSKRSIAISHAIAITDDGNTYPNKVNQIPYYSVTPNIINSLNRDDVNIKRVPHDEIIPAHELIVENIIVTCAYEGEMMVVKSARAGCLVCACVGAGNQRAVCAACDACAVPPPTVQPTTRLNPPCDQYSPRQLFTDPLNPCRQCICIPNAYGILSATCMPNPDCKIQQPESYPQIIPTSPWIPKQSTDFPPMFPYPYPGSEIVSPPTQVPDTPKSQNLYPIAPLFPPVIIPAPTPTPSLPYPPYVPQPSPIRPEPPSVEPLPSPTPYAPFLPSVPFPQGLDEPLKWPPKSPLPGPRPHKSCAPFPVGIPFQHPWSECLACVCEHVSSPPISDIEVTCYTKPSCCIEPSTSVGPPRESSTELQILDRVCEARPLGSSFADPRDSCRVCVCRAFGTRIAPACTPAPLSSPQACGMLSEKKAKQISIKFIEPRCKYVSPYQAYTVGCSRCVCETVFFYVIAHCTPVQNCVNPLSSGTSSWLPGISGSSWLPSQTTAEAISGAQNQISLFRPTNDLNPDYYQNNYLPNSKQNYPYFPSGGSIQSEAIAQADGSTGGQAAAFAQVDSNAAFAQAGVSSSGDSEAFAQADSSAANAYPYSSADSQVQSSALADTAFAQADASSYPYSPQTGLHPSNDLYSNNPSDSSIQTVPPFLSDDSPYGNMFSSPQINNHPQSVSSNQFTGVPYNNAYPYSSNGKPVLVSGIKSPSSGSSYPFNPSISYGQTGAPPTVNSSPYSNNVYPYPFQAVTSSPPAMPPYSYSYPQASAASQADSSVFDNSYPYNPGSSSGSAQASASAQADSSYRNSSPYSSNSQASAVAQGESGNLFPGNSGNPYSNAFPDSKEPLRFNDITTTARINSDTNQQYNNLLPLFKASSPPSNINSQYNPNMLGYPSDATNSVFSNGYPTPSVASDRSFYPQTDSSLSPTEGYYSPTTDPYSFNYARPTVMPPWASSSSSPDYRGSAYSAAEASAKGPSSDPHSKARLYPTGGRGQCHFDGDMYHVSCQACFCRADAAGNLLATCYGTPCS